jgi:hypothetical protein
MMGERLIACGRLEGSGDLRSHLIPDPDEELS